ncbi:19585_t:CDS:1, partial [Gigaspora rosea]
VALRKRRILSGRAIIGKSRKDVEEENSGRVLKKRIVVSERVIT